MPAHPKNTLFLLHTRLKHSQEKPTRQQIELCELQSSCPQSATWGSCWRRLGPIYYNSMDWTGSLSGFMAYLYITSCLSPKAFQTLIHFSFSLFLSFFSVTLLACSCVPFRLLVYLQAGISHI